MEATKGLGTSAADFKGTTSLPLDSSPLVRRLMARRQKRETPQSARRVAACAIPVNPSSPPIRSQQHICIGQKSQQTNVIRCATPDPANIGCGQVVGEAQSTTSLTRKDIHFAMADNLDSSDHEDSFASPPNAASRSRTPTNQNSRFDVEESREAALRKELEGVRKINEVIEGVIGTLERAKGNMGVRWCDD
jgi:hypothetical protein